MEERTMEQIFEEMVELKGYDYTIGFLEGIESFGNELKKRVKKIKEEGD